MTRFSVRSKGYIEAKVTSVTVYYNEIDPYAAQWLRNLISAGHIAPGDRDERTYVESQASIKSED